MLVLCLWYDSVDRHSLPYTSLYTKVDDNYRKVVDVLVFHVFETANSRVGSMYVDWLSLWL